jgi:hypothetical protein
MVMPGDADVPFVVERSGKAGDMDEEARSDRHRTDEPDGTPAYAASLRPPGESVTPTSGAADDDGEPEPDDGEPLDTHHASVAAGESRAGYDVDAATGDSDEYRPD